ncbi:hypothetical protein LEP1GSC202_1535 [Leptospira yanagawae serovar Saopaulo str. Sao Paulo = ATCC 700523]|uniref:Uncharacterized protein n=1 Tax=Leptospira yanagawae serovar Saopaulo str. Sao Paulo = ATCC 700523 TaxID=1249483 RepID=A0A5E8HGJ8_9LEPT|nr:hypothetical protein LEP1GSC202_1535 [Leptospira yanagawae serovar Saopaulo str. Sao Paulo = ATCC 700523]
METKVTTMGGWVFWQTGTKKKGNASKTETNPNRELHTNPNVDFTV